MAQSLGQQEIVGRAMADGARLFRDWYENNSRAAESSAKVAYVFCGGSMLEVLRAFDFHIVFPEINSLQTAIRKVAQKYLLQAEDYGHSPDICGYVKADVATQLSGGEHPSGRIPKPSIAVLTSVCNTYIKWAEIWERFYQIPLVTIDIPGSRSAAEAGTYERAALEPARRYVEHQLRELIAECERVSGKKFDIDRLREAMGYVNRMSRAYRRMVELNRHVPSPFNALSDTSTFIGVANVFRGTVEGAEYFERVVEELEYKIAHNIGALPEEKYRLLFIGVPCFPIFRSFSDLFTRSGGLFVLSSYMLFAPNGLALEFDYDLDRPMESLAAGILASCRYSVDVMFHSDRMLVELARDYSIEGIVFHPIKSCRTVSTGLADVRRSVMERTGVPTLYIESDLMDKRVVSEAQLRNRIEAFFEALASKKIQKAASAQRAGATA